MFIAQHTNHRSALSALKHSIYVIIALAVGLAPAGCDSPTEANGEAEPDEVVMEGNAFLPPDIEVEAGTTVTWINEDQVVHTVTSGTDGEHDGIFDSGNLQGGEEWSYEFNEPGTYEYYCIPHVDAGMTGTVTVVE